MLIVASMIQRKAKYTLLNVTKTKSLAKLIDCSGCIPDTSIISHAKDAEKKNECYESETDWSGTTHFMKTHNWLI